MITMVASVALLVVFFAIADTICAGQDAGLARLILQCLWLGDNIEFKYGLALCTGGFGVGFLFYKNVFRRTD